MEKRCLHILWTNPDPLTSQFMVMMYAANSLIYGWWDEVTVIIWGATAKTVVENDAVRERMRLAVLAGVRFSACVSCALSLGVKEDLEKMEIEVKPWGEPLTMLIKEKQYLITV